MSSAASSADTPASAAASPSVRSGPRRSLPAASRTTSAGPSTRPPPPSGKGGVPKPPGVTISAISFPVAATRAGEPTCWRRRCRASGVLPKSGMPVCSRQRHDRYARNALPPRRTQAVMDDLLWHRVADLHELPEGRVKTVTAGHHSLALTHYDGRYGALSTPRPHQGGLLREGTIENGLLRRPWHGYDY